MLYDPKWEHPDREYEGVSLRSLIAWLETMPPQQEYNYLAPQHCALAQFLQARGVPIEKSMVDLGGVEPGDPGFWLDEIVNCGDGDWTFGAALKRARAIR